MLCQRTPQIKFSLVANCFGILSETKASDNIFKEIINFIRIIMP